MPESVKQFMDRLRGYRASEGDGPYIARLEREVEERLRINIGLVFKANGQPRDLIVCECGTVATGYAQARCGRDRRRNIHAGCPSYVRAVVLPSPVEPLDREQSK